jgi:ADP-ribose pyrophosphatase YjhB (NUDIX family)
MNIISKIIDEDIGLESKKMENPELREAARGIITREDGKIAIFNKSNKNEYKLPGGGIEGNEKPEEAFKREALEETGCIVEITKKIGITEEYKSLSNFKQISYVFIGKVIEDTKLLNITQKEKEEGAKLLWETPKKALELITNCYDKLVKSDYESVYSSKFIVLRDRRILEYYIKNKL